jgi:hypothetical protein
LARFHQVVSHDCRVAKEVRPFGSTHRPNCDTGCLDAGRDREQRLPGSLSATLRTAADPLNPDSFFAPRTALFAALATLNLTTVSAGILIFWSVFGLMPIRAFRFCFTSLPKPGATNSPSFLIAL